jgi:hypothetical protein
MALGEREESGYAEAPMVEMDAFAAPLEAAPGPLAEKRQAGPAAAAALDTEDVSVRVEEEPGERKRVYSGFCRLTVDDAEKTKEAIADIAEESGGYVESVHQRAIVVRVPAELFQVLFDRILGLGEVEHKSVETYDVTEFFRDQETRLIIAEKTRERLYALLDRTEDVEERLAILREIKRLTEEIERIRRTLDLLERQISFSRIVIELLARLPQVQIDRSSIPFRWIANLNPLYPSLGSPKRKIALNLSDNFAIFEKEEAFRAESAEGIRVRLGEAKNEPRGDSAFWQKAIAYHLSPFFESSEQLDIGSFKAILFISKDASPFSYLVGVLSSTEETLLPEVSVVEVFFPDQETTGKHLDSLRSAIGQVRRQ